MARLMIPFFRVIFLLKAKYAKSKIAKIKSNGMPIKTKGNTEGLPKQER